MTVTTMGEPTKEELMAFAKEFWAKFMVGDQPHMIPLYENAFLNQAAEFAQAVLLNFQGASK